jgi:hypothetical protein
MGYARTTFNSSGAPAFSVELPPGLILVEPYETEPSISPLPFATQFAAIAAVNGPAAIMLSSIAATKWQSLSAVLLQCAAHRGSSNPAVFFESIGGETHRHPALWAEVRFGCEFAVFEDGGTIFVMEAAGASPIWREFEPFLKGAMLSVELFDPRGPTIPLSADGLIPQLEAGIPDPDTVAAAAREKDLHDRATKGEELIRAGRFEDAEALVVNRDNGPEVYALMGRLYQQCLSNGESQDAAVRENLYRRALEWKLRSYPEPHTEIEADNYSRGMAEDKEVLIRLLGYEPPENS